MTNDANSNSCTLHNLVCTFVCTSVPNAQAIASNLLFIEFMLCVQEGGFYNYNNAQSIRKLLPMQVSILLQYPIPLMSGLSVESVHVHIIQQGATHVCPTVSHACGSSFSEVTAHLEGA